MTTRSSSTRVIGLALFLVMGLAPLTPSVYGVTAPIVRTLNSIKEGVRTPVRLAISQSGDIYVTDPRGGGLNKYNNAGKLMGSFHSATTPKGVAVAANGDILVSRGNSVMVLDANSGSVKKSFGSFKKSNGIAVDSAGLIYIADGVDNCVQVFNSDLTPHTTGVAASGKPLNSFGSAGRDNGLLLQPSGISYEKLSNQLAVVDTLNGRVQFFSTAGLWQKTVGAFGSGPLQFTLPQSIAFEYSADGQKLMRMYVVDTFQGNVQVLDATANERFLRYIGGYGMKSGNLVVPSDLLFDSSDSANSRLIVANGSGSLTLFGISGGTAGAVSTGPALTIGSYPLATNLTALPLTGTTTSGAAVRVNGVDAAVSGTTWTASLTLNVGANVLTVAAVNASGTSSRTITINVISQTGTPVVLAFGSFPSPTGENVLTLSGTVTSGASVTVDGVSALVTGSSWSCIVTLASGANNLLVIGKKEGLSDAITSINVLLDDIKPLLTVYALTDGSTSQTPVQSISGTVTDASATVVTAVVNGSVQAQVPVNNGLYSLPVILALGKNDIIITAKDIAGNISIPDRRALTYDPTVAEITVAIPGDAVVNPPAAGTSEPQYTFTFITPAGFTVTVTINGIQVTVTSQKNLAKSVLAAVPASTDITWTVATNNLLSGLNQIEIKAADVTDPVKVSTVAKSITYSSEMPSVGITTPSETITTTAKNYTLVGTSTPGVSITALVNGSPTPVSMTNSGNFAVTVAFTAVGSYAVEVSATDANGNTSASNRTLVYDDKVPTIEINKSAKTYKAKFGGILYAKDSSGKIVPVPGSGSGTLDLSGYDASSLNIYALGAGGGSSRDGDINRDGSVDISDALKVLQFSLGAAQASDEDKLYSDVTMTNGKQTPDGRIRLDDVITILHKAVGFGQ